jgi:hypothetical protein
MAKLKAGYKDPAVPLFQGVDIQGILGDDAFGVPLAGEDVQPSPLLRMVPESASEPGPRTLPEGLEIDSSHDAVASTVEGDTWALNEVGVGGIERAQLLTRLRTASKRRVRGYTSHMCSEGSELALLQLQQFFERCGYHRGVQERFLWNLGLMMLAEAATNVEEDLVPKLSELGQVEEDTLLYELVALVRSALASSKR